MPNPTANDISVAEVLSKFEADFASTAEAVANGEFAFWVGSGISRQAPNLGNLIERALDFLRERAIAPATAAAYMPAFKEALTLADVHPASVAARFGDALATWPEHDVIVSRLWNNYSRVLDIRVEGEPADFVLWEAIDIRKAFAHSALPSAEHLCIAILIIERAVQHIASANWDGFIEAAVDRLSNGVPGVMQVVVDPNQLRGAGGHARLLKFHGCIVHAALEPAAFRRFLTGSSAQIIDWPEAADSAAMRGAAVALATTHKTLVLGLSIQDNNLKALFARAKAIHAWPWPCAPAAPAHVFCEDAIQQGQRDVLRVSYGEAYNQHAVAIHDATLLRAWGEKVLIALVLKVLCDKLARLMALALDGMGKAAISPELRPLLEKLRNDVALLAVPPPGTYNRTAFVNQAIARWSRMLSLFRTGLLPRNGEAYEALSHSTLQLLPADQNAQAMGLGRLAIALSLLQHGRANGHWELAQPASDDLIAGVLAVRALRTGAAQRPLFIVKSAGEAIALQSEGAFAKDDAVVVHADDTWHRWGGVRTSARRMSTAPGRTGHAGETHVSLGTLLGRANDAPSLQREFVQEMML